MQFVKEIKNFQTLVLTLLENTAWVHHSPTFFDMPTLSEGEKKGTQGLHENILTSSFLKGGLILVESFSIVFIGKRNNWTTSYKMCYLKSDNVMSHSVLNFPYWVLDLSIKAYHTVL